MQPEITEHNFGNKDNRSMCCIQVSNQHSTENNNLLAINNSEFI